MSRRERAALMRAKLVQWQHDVERGVVDTRKAQTEARREARAKRDFEERLQRRTAKYTIQRALWKVLKQYDKPMTKTELYEAAVRLGWIRPMNEPRTRMHKEVGEMRKAGIVEVVEEGKLIWKPRPVPDWVKLLRPRQPSLSTSETLQHPEDNGTA